MNIWPDDGKEAMLLTLLYPQLVFVQLLFGGITPNNN